MDKIRTRFAPSPTGFLHIGGARTALFNFAYAKHFGGEFFLRIEDTDLERSTKEFEADIISSLNWLSIYCDGDILYQTNRLEIYKSYAERLIEEGKAYYCFCSKELLDADREKLISEGKKPMYVQRCRNLDPEDAGKNLNRPHVIRFKVDRKEELSTGFRDIVRNQNVNVDNNEIDDFVIMREGGIPTYNFAVAVDDALTGITHIIRGDDHVSNTPKQIMVYNALGFNPPQFAHVSMILGPDGKRLSKRHGATSVNQYREEGFLPEALVNYLIRLGWSHGNDEIFSMDDIVKFFDMKNISKSAATFNTEKLLWLNSHYIKSKDAYSLIDSINNIAKNEGSIIGGDIKTFSLVNSLKTRVKLLSEFSEKLSFYIHDRIEYKGDILKELSPGKEDIVFLDEFKNFINGLPDDIFADYIPGKMEIKNGDAAKYSLDIITSSVNSIKEGFTAFLTSHNCTMKEKAMLIRVVLTGEKISPPIYEMIFALGKKRCENRIVNFSKFISE